MTHIPFIELLDKNTQKILQWFFSNPDEEASPAMLEKMLGTTHMPTYRRVRELHKKGILKKSKKVFKEQFYRLNIENPSVRMILDMDYKKVNDNIFHMIQVVRSELLKSRNRLINRMSITKMIDVLLLIALQSNIKETDPRLKMIKEYLRGENVIIDDKKLEKFGEKIVRAMYYLGG